MNESKASTLRSSCPVNAAVELLGDRWSLLVIRDIMFRGYRTYSEFLKSGEGIATNMLADRLKKLVAGGIIYVDGLDTGRPIYRLTPKGIDLAPAIVELILWSASHEKTLAPLALIQRIKKNKAAFVTEIRRSWKQGGTPIASVACLSEAGV